MLYHLLMGNHSRQPIREGSVIVITGASSGLGKQVALQLSRKRVRLILAGRNRERLQEVGELCQQGGSQVLPFIGDLSEQDTCKQLISNVIKSYNRIDYLILNAGVNAHFHFSKQADLSVFDALMRTNFHSNVYLTKHALPHLKKSKGKIVGVSSLSGKFGLPSRSAYCASKFAFTGFMEALRTEEDVSILMVYPTSLQTPMRSHSLVKGEEGQEEKGKREDPVLCACEMVKGMESGVQSVYVPWKGWLGVTLQPIFPRLIRWKVSESAKL